LMERRISKQLRRYLGGHAGPCAVDGQLHHDGRRFCSWATLLGVLVRKQQWPWQQDLFAVGMAI
jgi:hypothetical protein